MGDQRMDDLERRLDELEGRSSALERAMDAAMVRSKAAMSSVLPEETKSHMRAAWREQLLAVRSLLDHWANRMSDDSPSAKEPPGRENIPID
jgi:uncharacterized coiled-coil protein SlyX